MSTQTESSLVWQARIRHAERARIATALGELLLQCYGRACSLAPVRTGTGFNPQTMAFRVTPSSGRGWCPGQVNLHAPDNLQSDDRIMWRVQAPLNADGDHEWPEIGQVYWNLVDDTVRYMLMPQSSPGFGGGISLRASIYDRHRQTEIANRVSEAALEALLNDDREGLILGPGAINILMSQGSSREDVGRHREVIRRHEHFPLLPPRIRVQALQTLAQVHTESVLGRSVGRFEQIVRSNTPMTLDQIESWVIERLIALRHYTSDEIADPEARASAIQAAMIRNNVQEFDELTRLGLSCLARSRVRTERQRRYGGERNPCSEIRLPMQSPPVADALNAVAEEVMRNGWAEPGSLNITNFVDYSAIRAQGEPINEPPVAAGTRMTIDRATGHVRPALQDEPVMGIATGLSTPEGMIELSTRTGNIVTPRVQPPEVIRGISSNVMIIDEEARPDRELLRRILGSDSFDDTVNTAVLTREMVEQARNLPRDIEHERRRRRQDELRAEMVRIMGQMFDPAVDDGSMTAADMALTHLRFRLSAMLAAVPVGRLKVEARWNDGQALDVVITDPQNGDVEVSRIRMDDPNELDRRHLPEAAIGMVGERVIDL